MKQYIVFYPEGDSLDTTTGKRMNNRDLADEITKGLLQGATVCLPNTWRVQIVDAPSQVTIEPPKFTQEERDAFIRLMQHKGSSTTEDLR